MIYRLNFTIWFLLLCLTVQGQDSQINAEEYLSEFLKAYENGHHEKVFEIGCIAIKNGLEYNCYSSTELQAIRNGILLSINQEFYLNDNINDSLSVIELENEKKGIAIIHENKIKNLLIPPIYDQIALVDNSTRYLVLKKGDYCLNIYDPICDKISKDFLNNESYTYLGTINNVPYFKSFSGIIALNGTEIPCGDRCSLDIKDSGVMIKWTHKEVLIPTDEINSLFKFYTIARQTKETAIGNKWIIDVSDDVAILEENDLTCVIQYNNNQIKTLLEPCRSYVEFVDGSDIFIKVSKSTEEDNEEYILNTKTGKKIKGDFLNSTYIGTSKNDIDYFYDGEESIASIQGSDGTIIPLPVGLYVELNENKDICISFGAKKQVISVDQIPLLPSILSCSEKPNVHYSKSNVEFEGRGRVGSGLSLMIDYPDDQSILGDNVRFWISEEISSMMDGQMPGNIFGTYIPLGSSGIEDMYSYYQREYFRLHSKEDSLFHTFYADLSIGQQMKSKDYTTYYVGKYQYSGGTHGMTNVYYRTFDNKTGKILTSSDIIKKEHLNKVLLIANKKLGELSILKHEGENIFELEEGIAEKINNGFSIDASKLCSLPQMDIALLPEGIVFCYQPYEIDAYAWGGYEFIVSYEELKGLIDLPDATIKKLKKETFVHDLYAIDLHSSEKTCELNSSIKEMNLARQSFDDCLKNDKVFTKSFLENAINLAYLSEKQNFSGTELDAACMAYIVSDSLYGKKCGITIAAADYWASVAQPTDAVKLYKYILNTIDKNYGKDNNAYIHRLHNLMNAEYPLGLYYDIVNQSMEMIDLYKKLYGENIAKIKTIELCLIQAQNMAMVGKYKEAIKFQKQALDYESTELEPTGLYDFMSLLVEGEVTKKKGYDDLMYYYYLDGQYEKAIEAGLSYEERIGTNVNTFDDKEMFMSLLYCLSGNYDEAVNSVKKWVFQFPSYIADCFKRMKSDERNQLWNKYSFYYRDLVPYIAKMTNDETLKKESYNAALLGKGLLLNTEMEISQLIKESNNTKVTNLYKQLINNQELLKESINEFTNWEIDSITKESNEIENEIIKLSTAYGDYTKKLKINFDDVKNKLNNNDIAVEFLDIKESSTKTEYIAFIAKKDIDIPILIPLCTKEQIENIRDVFDSKELSTLIWKPISKYIKEADNVFFSPSGDLYNIALESLPHWDNNGLVSDYWNIYRLSSTRELALPQTRSSEKSSSVYGGLKYDADTITMINDSKKYPNVKRSVSFIKTEIIDSLNYRKGIANLPETLIEAVAIDSILKKRNIKNSLYTDIKGTEASFKALSGSGINILHVATHGFYWTEEETQYLDHLPFLSNYNSNPKEEDKSLLRSGLFFSGADNVLKGDKLPDSVEDGVLTAKEIALLDFRNVGLVVLSACQTGLGDISADGVMGLQRSFKKAGAKTILMSLKEVDDKATQMLMKRFYENLYIRKNPKTNKNYSKHDALKEAQKYIREYEVEVEVVDNQIQSHHYNANIRKDQSSKTTHKRIEKIKKYASPDNWAVFVLLDALEN